MKKFLVIFLLLLLPLQYSWAAVASYCQHEAGVSAKHLGHHSHDYHAVDHQEAGKHSSQTGGIDHDCATCHLGCAAALTGSQTIPTATTAQDNHFVHHANRSQASSEPPERPQWHRLA
jgi:hypothetical protein